MLFYEMLQVIQSIRAHPVVSADYLTKVAVRNKASKEIKVSEIMTERSKLMTVDPNHTTMDAMTMMIKFNFRHVPVVSPLLAFTKTADAGFTVCTFRTAQKAHHRTLTS